MERKLIKQGGGGFTIYLPKKWVESKGLKEGQEITLEESEGILIIGSQNLEKKQIELNLNESSKKDLKNLLTHMYRKGFDKINITNIDANTSNEIKNTIPILLGFEITEKTQSSLVLENISEPTDEKYEVLLRRIFLIVLETLELIIKDFKSKIKSQNEIDSLREQQDKFILFCRRLIMKEKYNKNSVLSWELLTFLMHIQHSMYYLYTYSTKNKIKPDKEMNEILLALKEYFEIYYKAYYAQDLELINKINNLKNSYQFGKCLSLIENSKGKNAVVYSYIRESFRLIQIGMSPILSQIVEKQIK